ncbi:DeoR/GlpR family DNA-binding transcription regulator [Pengzhenrongella frigida]|uniref:DeoR/GlpR transcriptional regulator n=1 Tax=Pengzhenrongella frigida TaxID=1259133 RepID=A0A4Q5N214_9MICO|nr:DeoR/GlpR family DNA-binding transcription regulator [Cellulomonas sp. HLT2-17]RYV52116.1 DeoR/GlpR transcriptional regulator [Cellulomonas sp. HLT2-17]
MSRRADIITMLQDRGFQSVNDLASNFGVDSSTIRRDLDKLEAQGLVERTHGGVILAHGGTLPATQPETLHAAEKEAIGAAMAERVLDGQTIFVDSGATTLEVARHLNHARLTVVTNDLRIGLEISSKPSMHLVFIGGELLAGSYAMWGPISIQQIENLRVNVAIFGADTVMEDGIYSTSSYEIELKRKMRSIASEAFFVADSSKFGREALFKVFGFEDFTAGISDATLDPIRAASFPVPVIRAAVRSPKVGARPGALATALR